MYIIAGTMTNQETLYQVTQHVATITLNRPDKLNAWTAVMEREVREAMEDAERDENVRVIILTGAGRGFCAGADMSLLSSVAEHGLDERGREHSHKLLTKKTKSALKYDEPTSKYEKPLKLSL